jgi:hypothetical protein
MASSPVDILVEICRYTRSNHLQLGAVRAQKLLYLLECEHYAWERSRLTDLDWQFYHYGPWSATLDRVVREEFHIESEVLPDGRTFHKISYEENEYFRRPSVLSGGLRGMFLRVMETWAAAPLTDLLDYVYFQTAPMRVAQRGQPLDFSVVPPARETRFPINPYGLLKRDQKDALRTMLARWGSRATARRKPPIHQVDEPFAETMQELDEEERPPALTGEVTISEQAAEGLKEQAVE